MRKLATIVSVLSLLASAGALAAHTYKVIPFESYRELDGLPPRLAVTYQLRCYQTFVKVVRSDEPNSVTGKVTIAVGILVREEESNCSSAYDKTVDAGTTYSGLEYIVVGINSEL